MGGLILISGKRRLFELSFAGLCVVKKIRRINMLDFILSLIITIVMGAIALFY